jgi:hypothetical protein
MNADKNFLLIRVYPRSSVAHMPELLSSPAQTIKPAPAATRITLRICFVFIVIVSPYAAPRANRRHCTGGFFNMTISRPKPFGT